MRKRLCVRSVGQVLFCLLLVAVCAPVLLTSTSRAAVYDDFSGPAIDPLLWTSAGTPGLFTQGGGVLSFSSSTAPSSQTLVSTMAFADPFTAKVDVYNFSSTSTYPPGYTGPGSGALFRVGPPTNSVFIGLINNTVIGDAFVSRREDNGTQIEFGGLVGTSATEGMLGFSYVGGVVYTMYNEGFDVNTGWHLLGTLHPNWGTGFEPQIDLFGADFSNGATSFQFDNVTYASVPEPSVLFLLVSSLLGLVAARKWRKR